MSDERDVLVFVCERDCSFWDPRYENVRRELERDGTVWQALFSADRVISLLETNAHRCLKLVVVFPAKWYLGDGLSTVLLPWFLDMRQSIVSGVSIQCEIV